MAIVLRVKANGRITNAECQSEFSVSKRTASGDLGGGWCSNRFLIKLEQRAREFFISSLKGQQRGKRGNLVVRNWLFGWYIVEYQQNGSDRAIYGKQLLIRLSDALCSRMGKGYSVDNLELMRKFYSAYSDIQQAVPVKSSIQHISEKLSRILKAMMTVVIIWCACRFLRRLMMKHRPSQMSL